MIGRRRGSRSIVVLILAGLAAVLVAACGSARPAGSGTSAAGRSGSGHDSAPAGNVVHDRAALVDDHSMALSPRGAELVAACAGSRLCVWNTTTGTMDRSWAGAGPVAWTPEGAVIASGGPGSSVVPIDAASGRVLRTLRGPSNPKVTDESPGITALAFSPNGTTLASSGFDRSVVLWSVEDGRILQRLDTKSTGPTALAFDPNGTRLAVTTGNRPVQVWDVASGKLRATLTDGPSSGDDVTFSADGRQLAAIGAGHVYLWNARTLALEKRSAGSVTARELAFSPDGTMLAYSGGSDKSVLLWQPAKNTTRRLFGHNDIPHGVRFSPNGRDLYSASSHEGILKP